MQNKQQTNAHKNHLRSLPPHERYLVAEVKKVFQAIPAFSPEQMEQLILTIPAQCREMAIRLAGQQLVYSMTLHMLQLATAFYQYAETEGIDEDERDETLQDIKADLDLFMDLARRLAVDTPETLARLAEITASIQNLSQCRSAEEMQSWLYDLPVIYQESLEREQLLQS